jgi:hypothetical protein
MRATVALLLTFCLTGFRTPYPVQLHEVSITATDYAFHLPQRINAGVTAFSFEDRGAQRHEMALLLLKQNASTDSAVKLLAAGAPLRDLVDGQAALIVTRPHELPGPKLLLNLKKARTYFVVCNLKDAPDKPAHATLGMFAKFIPE